MLRLGRFFRRLEMDLAVCDSECALESDSFLRTPEDYWETVGTAIVPGGDVDTTAAMAGAISGTHVGIWGLPSELVEQVNDQGQWGFGELVELSHRCYRIRRAEIHGKKRRLVRQ